MLNLDINKEITGRHIVYGRVGDNNSHIEKVSVINSDGTPFSLTGISICFMGNTHQNQTKVIDSDGVKIVDAAKGLFQYTFPSMAFGVAGPYERAYFQFTNKDGVITSTGDFEVIVLDNTDITSNEAETVITEYNKLVAELNELQNQAIDEMNRNFTEAQGRISELEVQINDLRNKIDQALTDFENGNFWTKEESFNKEESSANVIYQLIGKETVKIPIIFDFEGKIATSNVENPHKATAGFSSVLPVPSQITGEVSQNAYNALSALDGNVINPYTAANKDMTYLLIQWNVLEAFKRILGDTFFNDRGATTVSECMDVVRSIVKEFSYNVFGYGTGPSGNSLNTTIWNGGGAWSSGVFGNKTNTVSKISRKMTSKQEIEGFLNSDGNASIIAYSEKADGATKAAINVDYVSFDFTIEISANEHIKSMMAAYQAEKNNATKEEAEAGEDNTKTMTPLRTKQQIDKRMATKEEVTEGIATDKLVSPATLPKYIYVEVGDWVALTLNPGFIAADSSIPQYRITSYRTGDVVKKLVEFRGAVTLSTGTIDSVFNTISAATIASELRPAQKVMVSCSTNVLSVVGRVHVAESGNIMIGQNSGQSVNYLYLNNLRYWLD